MFALPGELLRTFDANCASLTSPHGIFSHETCTAARSSRECGGHDARGGWPLGPQQRRCRDIWSCVAATTAFGSGVPPAARARDCSRHALAQLSGVWRNVRRRVCLLRRSAGVDGSHGDARARAPDGPPSSCARGRGRLNARAVLPAPRPPGFLHVNPRSARFAEMKCVRGRLWPGSRVAFSATSGSVLWPEHTWVPTRTQRARRLP